MPQEQLEATQPRGPDQPGVTPTTHQSWRRRTVDVARRALPWFLTIAALGLAIALGKAAWHSYFEAPWTRDGTVRAYVVTMASEVSGRIVDLKVADNQYVHASHELTSS
jgi:multidrug resistance efflux pump